MNRVVKVDEFVYDEAYEVIVKKILKKGFIEEIGFKQLISPFKEVIEKRLWKIICDHMPLGRVALVREFYANLVGRKDTNCYVRGKWVSFHRNEINQLLKMGKLSDGAKFKKLKDNSDYQKILEVLTGGKGEWKRSKKTPYYYIARGSLIEEAKVWFYFLSSVLIPSKHLSTVRQGEVLHFCMSL